MKDLKMALHVSRKVADGCAVAAIVVTLGVLAVASLGGGRNDSHVSVLQVSRVAATSFSPADVLSVAQYTASQLGGSGPLTVQQVLTTRGNAFRLQGILSGGGPQIQAVKGFDPSQPTYVVLMSGTFSGTPADAEGQGGGAPATTALLLVDASSGLVVGSSVWSGAAGAGSGAASADATAATNLATVQSQVAQVGALSTPVTTTASSTMPTYMQALGAQLANPTN